MVALIHKFADPRTGSSEGWIGVLGNPNDENGSVGEHSTSDSDGNVYYVGYHRTAVSGNYSSNNIVLSKFNKAGTLLWQRTWGTDDYTISEMPSGVVVGSDGSVYVVGTRFVGIAFVTPSVTSTIIISKFTSSGSVVWQRSWGATSSEGRSAGGVEIDSLDNLYVIATSINYNTVPIQQGFILKVTSAGALVWQREVRRPANSSLVLGDIHIDSNNNIYLAGYSSPYPITSGSRFWVAKLNTNGTSIWERQITANPAANSLVHARVTADVSGNVFVAGYRSLSGSVLSHDAVVIKFNSSGTFQWTKLFFHPTTSSRCTGIEADSSGNVYLSLSNGEKTFGFSSYIAVRGSTIVKLSPNGTLVWGRDLKGTNPTYPTASVLGLNSSKITFTDQNIIVTGVSTLTSTIIPPPGNVLPTIAKMYKMVVASLPTDGSKTGTYAPFVYSVSSTFSIITESVSVAGTSSSMLGLGFGYNSVNLPVAVSNLPYNTY